MKKQAKQLRNEQKEQVLSSTDEIINDEEKKNDKHDCNTRQEEKLDCMEWEAFKYATYH